jgi:hypothetical protein
MPVFGGDRTPKAMVVLGVLATAVGCTGPASTNVTASSPAYVTVELRIQQVGPTGTTPAEVKQVASAVDCLTDEPLAPIPAGVTYLVRLKIDTAHLTESLKQLRALHDVANLHTDADASFSTTPTGAKPGTTTSC